MNTNISATACREWENCTDFLANYSTVSICLIVFHKAFYLNEKPWSRIDNLRQRTYSFDQVKVDRCTFLIHKIMFDFSRGSASLCWGPSPSHRRSWTLVTTSLSWCRDLYLCCLKNLLRLTDSSLSSTMFLVSCCI